MSPDVPSLSTSMSDSPVPPPSDAGSPAGRRPAERRKNQALRELIDEMMVSIRTATQGELWSTDERSQYEQELAMIMSRVRGAAVQPPKSEPGEG